MVNEPSTKGGNSIGQGKKSKEWLKIRKTWVSLNTPNHEGYYICGICAKPVRAEDMELDHIEGREGVNFSDLSKLQPTHSWCNRMKGSQKWKPKVSSDEYQFRKELGL